MCFVVYLCILSYVWLVKTNLTNKLTYAEIQNFDRTCAIRSMFKRP